MTSGTNELTLMLIMFHSCELNLSISLSALQVDEKDDIWNHEALLTQLASELNSEIEKTEGMSKGLSDIAR